MKKKYAALILGIMLGIAVTGCSDNTEAGKQTVQAEEDKQEESITGEVISTDKESITVRLTDPESAGEKDDSSQEQTAAITENTQIVRSQGPGKMDEQEAPEKPEGDESSDDAGERPEDGEVPGEPPAGEMREEDITWKDIKEGDTVAITLDTDGNAVKITVRSDDLGQRMGQEMNSSSTGSITLAGVYTVDGDVASSEDQSYSSEDANENTVLVKNGGSLTMSGAKLSKTGDTTSDDESNFYAVNAVVAATADSTITVSDTEIISDAEGANAVFATGSNAVVRADHITIHTMADSSRGLDATYGGTVTAENIDITTEGAHSAGLATDRGEGTIKAVNGTISTSGEGSPCIYSTGDISAENITGKAAGAQTMVIEGKNSITITGCDLSGAGENGVMLYQSTSGDAAEGTGVLTVKDSSLTTSSDGPMFYVTNTEAQVDLNNVSLNYSSGVLINVSGNETNNWGTPGNNGGDLTFRAANQILNGSVLCDGISTVSMKLSDNTRFAGSIDADNTGNVQISMDAGSTWNVAGDSYVSVITDDNTSLSNIESNGHTIYYDASEEGNAWLSGSTIELSGGGSLTPAAE
ncbi:hypothetical protein MCG98_09670 [Ruminococcus sp. OA3]|uniref:hypothetical protein n=1 Tax=Ruminococcus sp. OA3 TaxID=2914164 RepID=UPI001F05F863|nr:hypothetical protein [Ruminococcus sp. OA3]MCH1982832.1 hypothetical protein [Ruminococcus sp. OA3]